MINRLEVQQTIIAAIMKKPEFWKELHSIVDESDFDDLRLREIHKVIALSAMNSDEPDINMVIARLDDKARQTIYECNQHAIAISKENVLILARELHNDTLRLKISPQIMRIALAMNPKEGESVDFQQLVTELRNEVDNVISGVDSGDNAKPLKDCLVNYLAYLQEGKPRYRSTGYSGIDKCVGGYAPCDLDVISARSGDGKSDIAVNFALASVKSGATVLYETLEMSANSITERVVSNKANVIGSRLRDIKLSPDDWQRIAEASDEMYNYNLFIDDRPSLTVSQLEAQINKYKPEIVIIDNLDLMKSERNYREKWREVEDICHSLKAMAKREKVCIVALDQLNRGVDSNSIEVAPKMADLYGGASIEHDASWIIGLVRISDNPCRVRAHIMKSRDGTKNMKVDFNADFAHHKWTEIDERYE